MKRSGYIQSCSAKQKKRLATWATATLARMVSVGNRCERCGATGVRLQGHHRRLRSQGGEDVQENCVVLCGDCHSWVHANPSAAVAAGLMEQGRPIPEEAR